MNRILMAFLIWVIVVVHNASCAETSDSDMQQNLLLRVGQTQLRLEGRNGICYAVASTEQGSAAQYALGIPWPCRFHTNKAGQIRTIQDSGYLYVLVESSKRATTASNDCETHLRSMRARGTSIEVSQHKDRVATCPPFQWDTVLFKELFN
jgi:hypothetical protein